MVWGGGAGVRVCIDIDIKHHFTPHHQISQTGPEVPLTQQSASLRAQEEGRKGGHPSTPPMSEPSGCL